MGRRPRLKKILLSILLLTSPAWATSYFVDNCVVVGNDSSNGTSTATPWLTLAKAEAATATSGDTVNFERSCVWRESRTGSHNITFHAYGSGARPSFRGSDTKNVAGNWTNKSGNLWYVSSITSDPGFVMHGDTQCVGQACSGLYGQRKTSEGALATQWDSWYDAVNSRMEIYSVANPTTVSSMLEVPVRQNFQANCASSSYDSLDVRDYYGTITLLAFGCNASILVNNLSFGPASGNVIQLNANTSGTQTATITASSFTDWGLVTGTEFFAVMTIGGAGPVTVSGNTATINHSQNSTGVAFVDQDDNSWIQTVTNNQFFNYGTKSAGAYGIYSTLAAATSILVSNNYALNAGICLDSNTLNAHGSTATITFSYNYCQNSGVGDNLDQHAARCYSDTGASPVIFANNVINGTFDGANTHAGIALDNCKGAKFYNNVVVGADDGILLKTTSTGNDFRNNGSAFNRGFGVNVSSGSITTFTNNGFFSNTSGNYSGISAGTGDKITDPLFVNRAGNDLSLSTSSPWIDAGVNLGTTYQLALDPAFAWSPTLQLLNQNSYGSGWELGPYVFVPTVITPPFGGSSTAQVYPNIDQYPSGDLVTGCAIAPAKWCGVHDVDTPGTATPTTALSTTPVSRNFTCAFTSNGGCRFSARTNPGSSNTTSTIFTYDVLVNLPSPTSINQLELDSNQGIALNQLVILGWQCNFPAGVWDYSTASGWTHTAVACTRAMWTAGQHHIILRSHRSNDLVGNVTYDSITFDGNTSNVNLTANSLRNVNWEAGAMKVNFQFNGNGNGSATINAAQLSSSIGTARPVAPSGLTGVAN